MRRLFALLGALLVASLALPAAAEPLRIVAAENFYGDIARRIGGDAVEVSSILSNPDQDPHLFEASPSTARAIAGSKIAILNGADYDAWMDKLLAANKAPGRKTINVAVLMSKKAGDNPHLWYDPTAIKAFARQLNTELAAADPSHKADFDQKTSAFLDSLKPLEGKISNMKQRHGGAPVTATEPVFGYMAQLLGLKMRNERFQLAMQNDTEPSASDVAAFETDLKGHKVKAVLFNSQANEPAAQRLVDLARTEKIPVVGITETEPEGKTYQAWMLDQLEALDAALVGAP